MRLQIKHFLRRISCPVFLTRIQARHVSKLNNRNTILFCSRLDLNVYLNMFKFYAHFLQCCLTERQAIVTSDHDPTNGALNTCFCVLCCCCCFADNSCAAPQTCPNGQSSEVDRQRYERKERNVDLWYV